MDHSNEKQTLGIKWMKSQAKEDRVEGRRSSSQVRMGRGKGDPVGKIKYINSVDLETDTKEKFGD